MNGAGSRSVGFGCDTPICAASLDQCQIAGGSGGRPLRCAPRAAAHIAAIRDRAEMVGDVALGSPRAADVDDNYLIVLAQAHGADAVVSGDRHLWEFQSTSQQMNGARV